MGLTKTELNLTNVIQPIPIFLIWGGIFAVFTLLAVSINSSPFIKLISIFAVVYGCLFVFIVFWIYCFCLGGQNRTKACIVTAVIVSITLVPTALLLYGFKPFVNVFANSVGYMYYSILKSSDLNNIFKFSKNELNNTKIFTPNTNVLLTLFNNYDTVVNDIEFFNTKYNTQYSPYNIQIILDNGNTDKLKTIISGKNSIGMLCWFYIATVFTSIISIKYLSTI